MVRISRSDSLRTNLRRSVSTGASAVKVTVDTVFHTWYHISRRFVPMAQYTPVFPRVYPWRVPPPSPRRQHPLHQLPPTHLPAAHAAQHQHATVAITNTAPARHRWGRSARAFVRWQASGCISVLRGIPIFSHAGRHASRRRVATPPPQHSGQAHPVVSQCQSAPFGIGRSGTA